MEKQAITPPSELKGLPYVMAYLQQCPVDNLYKIFDKVIAEINQRKDN